MGRAPFNFALTGVSGAIARRHLKAIYGTGNRLIAAVDPNDSASILDEFDLEVPFFTEIERFDRHLEKARRGPEEGRLHYLSVCSPNYVHDAQCRLGLRLGANVLCEKPIVICPWNLEPLRELESQTGKRVWTMLQLRFHERLVALRDELRRSSGSTQRDVVLTYVTPRGRWYDTSWKGNVDKSGGIATNIGIHMFDLLVWLFGMPVKSAVHLREPRRMAGFLELEQARVTWFLSVEARDLQSEGPQRTFRTMSIDGTEIDFSSGFADLHTRVYEATLEGRGIGLDEARASIELTHRLRTADIASQRRIVHPLLGRRR